MSWPAILLWLMIIAASFSQGPSLIYLLFISGVFGSLQMLPGTGGGATLLPQSACAALFVCKVLIQRGNFVRGVEVAIDQQKLLFFTAFILYSVVATVFLPRAFLELFEVVPVSMSGADLLRPSSGNVTQSAYMVVSYATALSFAIVGQSRVMRRHFLLAILATGYALIVAGIVDQATYTLHLDDLLKPFRNANYSLLTDNAFDDVKRVVGLMPEASVYGSATVGTLATLIFLRPMYGLGIERIAVNAAILLLFVMSVLSTSSTAYVGLVMLALLYLLDLIIRVIDLNNPRRKSLDIEIAVIVFASFVAFAIMVVSPAVFEPVFKIVDIVLFQKVGSSSFEGRNLWTQIGWQAFLDSGGMGSGLGSIRVSNWVVSILGSTGLLGGLLMFGFILQQLCTVPRGVSPDLRQFSYLMKLGLIPTMLMFQLSGTMPDIGVGVASALGMIVAIHRIGNDRSAMQIDFRTSTTSQL